MKAREVYKAWLCLGGNIGNVVQTMAQSLQLIDERQDARVIAVSPVFRTPPWGKTDQDWFYNACAEISTVLTPPELLEATQSIEKRLLRIRSERWGPRTIDIDLLAYESVFALEMPDLTLPHPRIEQRAFVLVPLATIAPHLQIRGKVVSDLLENVDASEIQRTSYGHRWWQERAV
ncbi:2-amino-4-hydroxy-6-hydroxymethyldihydropteridine diphosphokinase [Pseudochrobactrum sp. MP213Fo]|uniref:2-amino-4-hydroxy-6- hydroxymethyldihydropteridine diphosphokinase n=1 Tax=Pseudochrobactrum sp. MP213Fo TaxID=3022250 RepID=UPI003B9FFC98